MNILANVMTSPLVNATNTHADLLSSPVGILAIAYGIGLAYEMGIKGKTFDEAKGFPYRMYLRLMRWIGKQKDKADDTEPKV